MSHGFAKMITPLVAQEDTAGALFWAACVLVIAVLMFSGGVFLRKRMSREADFHGEGFTLGDLRQMRRSDKISEEEYERMKSILLEGMKGKTAAVADPLSGVQSMRLDTPPSAGNADGSGNRGDDRGGEG